MSDDRLMAVTESTFFLWDPQPFLAAFDFVPPISNIPSLFKNFSA
jgi:hypothetical protein